MHLSEQNISQADFARRIGVSPGYLSSLLSGRKRPSLTLAEKIKVETNGAVSVDSWLQDAAA